MKTFTCDLINFDTREAWLAGRRRWFGSSDTAGLLGVGYADQTPLSVIASKFADVEEKTELKRMRIGRLIEPALRRIFDDETGLTCIPPGLTTCVSKTHPYLGATLDGWTWHPEFGECVVELKNVGGFNAKEWKSDEPPLQYNCQVQHQLAVTGAKLGYLLGLVGGCDPRLFVVERNERFINEVLFGKLADYWRYVERRELPPVDDSAATGRLLAAIWPQDSGVTVHLPDEAAEWDRDLTQAKADLEDAERRKTLAENKIKQAIGEATAGVLPDGVRYTWTTQQRPEYVCKPTTYRVLRRREK